MDNFERAKRVSNQKKLCIHIYDLNRVPQLPQVDA